LSIGSRAEKSAPGLRRKRTAISEQKLNRIREQVDDMPISIWLRNMCIVFILMGVSGSVYSDGKDCAPSGIYHCKESVAIGIEYGSPRQWAEGEFLLELKDGAGETVSEAIIAYGESTWRLGKTYSRDGMDSALECVQGMIQARKGILVTFHMEKKGSGLAICI